MNNENDNNLLLYIIIILLIILVGIGGVLIYKSCSDKDINNNYNDNVNENDKVEENDDKNNNLIEDNDNFEKDNNGNSAGKDVENKNNVLEQISLDDNLIKKIIEDLNPFNALTFIHSTDSYVGERFGILYKKDKLLIKDLPANVRMHYVIGNMNLERDAQFDGINKYYVSKDKFKMLYHQLLGKDVIYEPVGYDYNCPPVFVEGDNIIIGYGCGDTSGPGYYIKHKYISAEKYDEKLNLYVRVALIEEIDSDVLMDKINIYSDLTHNNLVAGNVDRNDDIFSINYLDNYPLYKYTFKYNDNGDGVKDYKDYYFYSVEKVK